jgi:hypothetical protein
MRARKSICTKPHNIDAKIIRLKKDAITIQLRRNKYRINKPLK